MPNHAPTELGASGEPGPLDTAEIPTVAAVMNESPRTCSPFSSVTEASLIFKELDCGMVPVIDEGKPIGIVTDRDVAVSLAEYPDLATRPVSEIMTADPVTVTPGSTLVAAAKSMADSQVRRLLVVDGEGLLVGVVAWADLAPHLPEDITGLMVSEVVEP